MTTRWATVALAAAFLLAGCGGSNDSAAGFDDANPAGDQKPAAGAPAPAGLDRAELAGRIEPCPDSDPRAPARDEGLPDLTLECLGAGGDVSLAGLRGTPMVLNVWATWCGPCKEEAPYFQRLHTELGDQIDVIGVNYEDPPPERALGFADELGLRYAQVADPDGSLREPFGLGVGVPATFFVAADGEVVGRVHKPYRDPAELFSDVEEHLGVSR